MSSRSHGVLGVASRVALVRAGVLAAFALLLPACDVGTRGEAGVTMSSGVESYANERWALSFDYPLGYYLRERGDETPAGPQLAIVLVEDTPTNRAIVEGRATEATDGPTAITIDAFANPARLDAAAWMEQSTNWRAAIGEPGEMRLAGTDGVTFEWDGLYRGRSVVVAREDSAYVLSVTWLTPQDPIVADFERVLQSVRFGEVRAPGH